MNTQENEEQIFILLHAKGKEYIEHFSSIKLKYKKLTITYITAVFLALAFIASSKTTFIGINKVYIICFIATLSLIGVNLIRYLDIYVNHAQIRLLFKYLIALENKYPKLEKPYSNVNKLLYGKKSDPIIIDHLYYSSINFGILIFSTVILIAEITDHHPGWKITLTFSVFLLFLVWEILSLVTVLSKKLII